MHPRECRGSVQLGEPAAHLVRVAGVRLPPEEALVLAAGLRLAAEGQQGVAQVGVGDGPVRVEAQRLLEIGRRPRLLLVRAGQHDQVGEEVAGLRVEGRHVRFEDRLPLGPERVELLLQLRVDLAHALRGPAVPVVTAE